MRYTIAFDSKITDNATKREVMQQLKSFGVLSKYYKTEEKALAVLEGLPSALRARCAVFKTILV